MAMFRLIIRNKQTFNNILHRPCLAPHQDINGFLSVYPEVVQNIFESDLFNNLKQHKKHFVEILDYNVIKEKRFRPGIFLETYKILEKKENLTEDNLHKANIVAWCLELVCTYMNISDDVIDQSELRCKEICWYKKETVGLNAFNDAVFVYETAFILLKKYFSNSPIYLSLISLLRRIHVSFVIGQTIDWKLRGNGNPDFGNFNTTNYMKLGRYKGGFTMIEAPFQAAQILSENDDYETIKEVVADISYLYQIENNIQEIFQAGKLTKNIVNHIRQGQCTWMAVQVLEHGNSDLIETFKKNYGRPKPDCEKRVVDVYLQMDIYGKYIEHRKKVLETVHRCVNQINKPDLRHAILNLCEEVHT